jgi:uncharacterized protein YggE
MQTSFRPVLLAASVAVLCSVVVAMIVVSANRPPVFISSPAALSSTSAPQAGVITSGDATVSKRPDIAFLSVGVQSQQSTAAAAQTDLANKAAKLISRAKSLGVADKDISTSGYSVNPNYVQAEATINGYFASESLQIKWHNVDTVGKALDALVQQGGATQVGVGFGLADPKAAQAEARTLAIADARSRANAMASAAGVRLGPVVLVSDLYTYGGGPVYRNLAGAAAAAPSATQVPVGQLDIQVTVEVDFAIAA